MAKQRVRGDNHFWTEASVHSSQIEKFLKNEQNHLFDIARMVF